MCIRDSNIGAVATHHTSGGVILYPPGTRPEKSADPDDMRRLREIAAMATEEMGYPAINIFDHFMTCLLYTSRKGGGDQRAERHDHSGFKFHGDHLRLIKYKFPKICANTNKSCRAIMLM